MVNTFVGFVAGYNVEGGLAWGVAGATVATLLHLRPVVRLHHHRRAADRPHPHDRRFADALDGITIAVVGVIAALAVFVAATPVVRTTSRTGSWSRSRRGLRRSGASASA